MVPGSRKAYSWLLTAFQNNPSSIFLSPHPPGHFHSPIPDLDYIQKHRNELFSGGNTTVPGIQLHAEEQLKLISKLAAHYSQMPFSEEKREGLRYYFDNSCFGHGSAIILYAIMRYFRPNRIVEIGSGYSSAVMLDVNDRFFAGGISCSFIEPHPSRLFSLLTDADQQKHEVIVDVVQNVPNEIFTDLKENDILFIDSSHVAKIGSDVVHLLTDILPILQTGVIIHIHDIYWPFEYPEDWILSGIAWNESYLVKAFLQFNSSFDILLFNSYLAAHHREAMQEHMPLFMPDAGSSLWIKKTS